MKARICNRMFRRFKHKGQPYLFTYSVVAPKVSDRVLKGDFDIRELAEAVSQKLGDKIPCDDGDEEQHHAIFAAALNLGIPIPIEK